jgi:hypothetical protein
MADIDQLRRDLRMARQGLADCTKALDASTKREGELREENNTLKARMQKAVGLLLPKGTTLSDNWDNYEEPGY